MDSQGNASSGGFWDQSDPQFARRRSAALARTVAGGRSRPDTGGAIAAADGDTRVESASGEASTFKHPLPRGEENR